MCSTVQEAFGHSYRQFWLSQLGMREIPLASGMFWLEAKGAAEHPTIPETAPHNKELYNPKCQSCQG